MALRLSEVSLYVSACQVTHMKGMHCRSSACQTNKSLKAIRTGEELKYRRWSVQPTSGESQLTQSCHDCDIVAQNQHKYIWMTTAAVCVFSSAGITEKVERRVKVVWLALAHSSTPNEPTDVIVLGKLCLPCTHSNTHLQFQDLHRLEGFLGKSSVLGEEKCQI